MICGAECGVRRGLLKCVCCVKCLCIYVLSLGVDGWGYNGAFSIRSSTVRFRRGDLRNVECCRAARCDKNCPLGMM